MLPIKVISSVLNTRSKTGVLRAQIRNTMCGHRLRSCEARKKERKRERLLISLGVCTRALEIFFFISSAHILVHKKLPFRDNTHKNRGRHFFPIILLPPREHPSISLLSPLKRKETAVVDTHMASAMSWSDLENADGVRFSFNCWPDDRQSAQKCILPLGALVTPLKPIQDVPVRF